MTCPNCQAENAAGAEVCFTCGRSFAALTQGKLIDSRYEILGLLGKGGMGMVYRAHDRMLDEPVALKVLRSEYVDTPAMAERFRSEIKLARKVSHPNVCRIHGYGEDAGTCYISMELLDGVDLKQAIGQHPEGLPREEAFAAALQIAKGLAAIHEVGIIHRDLKTPNAMRDPAGTVKLMDFGIARSAEGRGHTKTGEVMGTPEYMSPEQCRGEKLDFRSDVYALGVVIFELFTGEVPFRGENIMATLFKQIGEAVPFDGPAGSRLPKSVVPVLEKALAKAPLERFQSVADLYAALRRAKRQEGPAAAEEPASIDDSLPPGPPAAAASGAERRAQSRLEIHVNVYLCRLDSDGQILHQERTIADNLSRSGARVMTSVPDLSVGDSVVLKEVSGDFTTPALVRNAYVGRDNIPRVGLEFVGKTAPDRLVRTESERLSEQRPASATGPRQAATAPAPGDSGPRAPGAERRSHSRLAISVEIALRRLHPEGSKEERTVADNISRGGARALTSMTDLKPGDRVALREINGDFATEAVVSNIFTGPDGIPRLGLAFSGNTAPDRLVPWDGARRPKRTASTGAQEAPKPAPPATSGAQPTVKPAAPASTGPQPAAKPDSGPTAAAASAASVEETRNEILELRASLAKKNHFEVLGIPRRSSEEDVKKAYLPLAKRFHPDAARDARLAELHKEISEIFVRVGDAYEVLTDPAKRARYEELLGPDRSRPLTASLFKTGATGTMPAAGSAVPAAPEAPPAPPPPESEEQRHFRYETTVRQAKKSIGESQFWDAIRLLEPLLDEPLSGRTSSSVRLLLAQALAKNPKWLKRAEELVISVVRDDPGFPEAHFALALVHRQAGLTARARTALRKVLELSPGNPAALQELEALDNPSPDGKR